MEHGTRGQICGNSQGRNFAKFQLNYTQGSPRLVSWSAALVCQPQQICQNTEGGHFAKLQSKCHHNILSV